MLIRLLRRLSLLLPFAGNKIKEPCPLPLPHTPAKDRFFLSARYFYGILLFTAVRIKETLIYSNQCESILLVITLLCGSLSGFYGRNSFQSMMLALRDGAIAEYDELLTRYGAETKLDNAA